MNLSVVSRRMNKELKVVKNQLQPALRIEKSAALQYESRIGEWYAARADFGDFQHSQKVISMLIFTRNLQIFSHPPFPVLGCLLTHMLQLTKQLIYDGRIRFHWSEQDQAFNIICIRFTECLMVLVENMIFSRGNFAGHCQAFWYQRRLMQSG